MTLNDFFEKGKEMAARYIATKETLENEIRQKKIAIAIEEKLNKAIVSVDVDRLNASISLDALPSFGFDEKQKAEMVQSICNTIRSGQYTIGDFIAAKNERIAVIRETLVGGVEELFDETDYEYRYKKELEEQRKNLLLITQQISAMAQDKEAFPDDMKQIVTAGDEIRDKLKFNIPIKTSIAKFNELEAALTGFAIMKSRGIEIDKEKAAEIFARIRVNIDNGENLFEQLKEDFAQTFDDVKRNFPDLNKDFKEIQDNFFSVENTKSQEIAGNIEQEKEDNSQSILDAKDYPIEID